MTTETEVVPAGMTDEGTLNFTQSMRVKMVNSITADGKSIPSDPKDRMTLLKALGDMDHQALSKQKLAQDKDMGTAAQKVTQEIAQFVMSLGNGLAQRPMISETPIEKPRPQLPDSVPRPKLVDGETDIVAPQENFDSFTRRMNPDIPVTTQH